MSCGGAGRCGGCPLGEQGQPGDGARERESRTQELGPLEPAGVAGAALTWPLFPLQTEKLHRRVRCQPVQEDQQLGVPDGAGGLSAGPDWRQGPRGSRPPPELCIAKPGPGFGVAAVGPLETRELRALERGGMCPCWPLHVSGLCCCECRCGPVSPAPGRRLHRRGCCLGSLQPAPLESSSPGKFPSCCP